MAKFAVFVLFAVIATTRARYQGTELAGPKKGYSKSNEHNDYKFQGSNVYGKNEAQQQNSLKAGFNEQPFGGKEEQRQHYGGYGKSFLVGNQQGNDQKHNVKEDAQKGFGQPNNGYFKNAELHGQNTEGYFYSQQDRQHGENVKLADFSTTTKPIGGYGNNPRRGTSGDTAHSAQKNVKLDEFKHGFGNLKAINKGSYGGRRY
uniref:Uncharacterized protein n=1 Tax=Stomoxys calcitrans TaxID=35570 RepID=A0A1I8PET9_STOCA